MNASNVYDLIGLIRSKESRRIVGLISGTSADGVSAAVTKIAGTGPDIRLVLEGFGTYPYPRALRDAVFQLFSPETSTAGRLCEMNFVLGEFFAESAVKLVEQGGLTLSDIDLIGSHGQTVYHSPKENEFLGYSSRSTLQIGEAAVVAERTGIPTVADFRKADVAAGGEGAPLTPYMDYVLHRHPTRSRVLQNIGGIANLTYLPANASIDDVIAFDTGPGNMLIDAVVDFYTDGDQTYDEDGSISARGTVDEELLNELLKHPFFSKKPPKTTGREEFGERFANNFLRRVGEKSLGMEDAAATATALTVESIARAYEGIVAEGRSIDEVYVSGGGAENLFLVKTLSSRLAHTPVLRYDVLRFPGEAKEAMLMAILANEHIMGTPSNVPRATGARRAVVLGQMYPAS